ncbi:MAG: hypothetical protein KAJ97_01080 [Acidobacteria bacterium]|nr:hypothetical protein [Acidobacteriota bacterium]
MSTQRKLNALLFELQTARTPLAQAKILARAWRTLRELSPTDRRLLARHVSFDGAEEMLEGLGTRKGGWAPAMLLQILSNARDTEASTVNDLIGALKIPGRRKEALTKSADLAIELLAEPEIEEATEEIAEEPEDSTEPVLGDEPSPEVALAALHALEEEDAAEGEAPASKEVHASEAGDEEGPEPEPAPPKPPVVDWSRWDREDPVHRPAPSVSEKSRRPALKARPEGRRPDRLAAALAQDPTVLSRLRRLRRELPGIVEADPEALRRVIEAFPEGWARRRALAALLEAGIPADPAQAVDLVADLEREFDRRWCLGILARRSVLERETLARALDLLTSPAARRRLLAAAAI